jgi:hypothetical protein
MKSRETTGLDPAWAGPNSVRQWSVFTGHVSHAKSRGTHFQPCYDPETWDKSDKLVWLPGLYNQWFTPGTVWSMSTSIFLIADLICVINYASLTPTLPLANYGSGRDTNTSTSTLKSMSGRYINVRFPRNIAFHFPLCCFLSHNSKSRTWIKRRNYDYI